MQNAVSLELRELESRRSKLQGDISSYNQKIEELRQEEHREKTELDRLKMSIDQAKVTLREALQQNTPDMALPKKLFPNQLPSDNKPLPAKDVMKCEMSNCFDYSRCSLTSGLPVYLYDPDHFNILKPNYDIDGFLKTTIKQTLGYNAHLVSDPKIACIFLVVIGEAFSENELHPNNRYNVEDQQNAIQDSVNEESAIDVDKLYKLPYWGGDGRNHVLLNLARRDLSSTAKNMIGSKNTMRAIVVQSSYFKSNYRPGYDIVVPPILGPPGGDVWQEGSLIVPARRLYLLSFQGEIRPVPIMGPSTKYSNPLDDFIVDHLNEIAQRATQDKFLLQFKCIPATDHRDQNAISDWSLCGTDSSRRTVLRDSTYVLILPPNGGQISSTLMQSRLYEALRSGAIPVILGADEVQLPYSETIDWRRVAVLLPKARITELHFLLRAITDTDILQMRRQGRIIWERYLSSVQSTVDTIISYLRDRLGIPPRPSPFVVAHSVFNSSFTPLRADPPVPESEPEESLGK